MHPTSTTKPWGNFREFTLNQDSTVKIIHVDLGQALSLQTHKNRSEFWRILKGEASITINDVTTVGKEGDEFFIPQGSKHRIEASSASVDILEIALGQFDEGDIVRLEDKYGRS
jgi:mannose-6-phosphate isomerase